MRNYTINLGIAGEIQVIYRAILRAIAKKTKNLKQKAFGIKYPDAFLVQGKENRTCSERNKLP